jgi:DNA polymerase/3'-5' exonuclease PolX
MLLSKALPIAERIRSELAPHCHRCEIAGSIRRGKAEPNDIEIVAIPKPYEIGLFESGIAIVVNRWQKVKGELPCKYTQRILPEGIKLDLFFASHENWGWIYIIRTGSADFSKYILTEYNIRGFCSKDGYPTRGSRRFFMPEEEDVFKFIGLPFVLPEERSK